MIFLVLSFLMLLAQARVGLVKIIRQFKSPKHEMGNHRPHWLVETHRLFCNLLRPDIVIQNKLVLIDQGDQHSAVVDRVVPVDPYVATTVLPSRAEAAGPIGSMDAERTDAPEAAHAADGNGGDAGSCAPARVPSGETDAPAPAEGTDDGTHEDAVAAITAAAATVMAALGPAD